MITKKQLKNQYPMAAIDEFCLCREHQNKNWFVSYIRLEEDLVYYKCGWERSNTDDIDFFIDSQGLSTIKEFVNFVKNKTKILKKEGAEICR